MGEPAFVDDYEAIARAAMTPEDFEEVAALPEGNRTMARTRTAWEAIALRTRVLPAAATPDLAVSVLGTALAWPVLLAPAGYHTRAHPDGELATARAAAALGTVMTVSANPGHPIGAVAAETPAPKWAQIYVYRDRAETQRRIAEAERLGFAALCLTLDAPWPAKRAVRARRAADRLAAAGTTTDLGEPVLLADPERTWADPAASWDDVAWLAGQTRLPVVGKGIMTAEDARLAIDHGLAGIVVSNHGGRLGDTAATIEVLPEVVDAVGDRIEVFLDGGIRRGSDVVKALALGARAVLIGRPVFWGLAAGGADGLIRLLAILREEIAMTMMLCGRPSIDRLDASLVTRAAAG